MPQNVQPGSAHPATLRRGGPGVLAAVTALLLSTMAAGAADGPGADATAVIHRAAPGPWGELEYSRIVIEPPDEFMARDYQATPARWNFAGLDDAGLERLWREAGLDDAQLRSVRDPARRQTGPQGTVIMPDDTLLLGLRPAARAVIYGALARFPGNPLQREPFRFRAEKLEEWFAGSGVRPEVVARIRTLLYPRGNALLFADPALVLPLVPGAEERVRLVKTLARKSTLLVKIRIRPDTDTDAIANYWSAGHRRKDVRPLLQSLTRHPGGMSLDLVHLLPRFARGLLYTYPSPDIPHALSPDCHWTAMNFFNEQPDGRFDNIDYLRLVLTRDYAEVPGPPAMGDVMLFSRADGEVLHSCIYLAADLVFTKNGQSHNVPWTLTTLPDLQAFYPDDPPLTVRTYRRKP